MALEPDSPRETEIQHLLHQHVLCSVLTNHIVENPLKQLVLACLLCILLYCKFKINSREVQILLTASLVILDQAFLVLC